MTKDKKKLLKKIAKKYGVTSSLFISNDGYDPEAKVVIRQNKAYVSRQFMGNTRWVDVWQVSPILNLVECRRPKADKSEIMFLPENL